MEKEITGTDKKLFSCADSAVIKAYKVLNYSGDKTGFPCIVNTLESEGGGGHLFDIMADGKALIQGRSLIRAWALF